MYEQERVIIFDARKFQFDQNVMRKDHEANEITVNELNKWLSVHPNINIFKRYIGYYNGLLLFVIWYK